ncbi:hypothetical protein ACFLU3_00425 [Chloroflexota bacterium]
MNAAVVIIKECRSQGATLTVEGDKIKVQAPHPLPDNLVSALIEAKPEIMAELQRQRDDQFIPWMLEEWRRISLPAWRRILSESIESNDVNREEYARWMLHEVLEDEEYTESDR